MAGLGLGLGLGLEGQMWWDRYCVCPGVSVECSGKVQFTSRGVSGVQWSVCDRHCNIVTYKYILLKNRKSRTQLHLGKYVS